MAELLLEIFSEEIPARMQQRASEDLNRMISEGLAKNGLSFSKAECLVTPRRLALVIDGLAETQPDVSEEKKGPRVGSPQAAVDGFLKSAGVTLGECEERDSGKGIFLFAVINKKGRPTALVLKDIIEDTLANFPWPKSMRWGCNQIRWVRPLHGIICLFAGKVVPLSFGPISASDETEGHRFLAPGKFKVSGFADYQAKLRERKVILDAGERRAQIKADAEKIAATEGLTIKEDEGLLQEVGGLVEYPVIMMGKIDQAFMDVPPEVLITAMRSHQKYFSLLDKNGKMVPRFIVTANKSAPDGGKAIIAGNERVLRARLSDAKFFWDQDRKAKLESLVPRLAERVFHAKLGSMAQKVERMEKLAAFLAQYIKGAGDVKRAARLAKADLSSGMVGEFPELQGIMGRYYALNDKEAADVAQAIAEHYSPQGPGDSCPNAPTSVAVALADKIDSLVGFFAADERPTGSKDPYALRRAALGVIRLVVENGLRLPLLKVFAAAHGFYAQLPGLNYQELLDFFADRLKVHLKEKGVRHDLVASVFALGGEDDLVRLLAKVEALKGFLGSDDGANLLIAYRRAANIVRIEEKKDGKAYGGAIDNAALELAEEKALAQALNGLNLDLLLEKEDYTGVMAKLATLRAPVDAFFDKVTVNSDDKRLRENRLKLLALISASMDKVADFSRIEG